MGSLSLNAETRQLANFRSISSQGPLKMSRKIRRKERVDLLTVLWISQDVYSGQQRTSGSELLARPEIRVRAFYAFTMKLEIGHNSTSDHQNYLIQRLACGLPTRLNKILVKIKDASSLTLEIA